MKAKLYRNIDLVCLPIKAGVKEYYLPQNVDWANKKIDRLLFCCPQSPCLDPVDGKTPIVNIATINSLDAYVNLYGDGEREIMHETHINNLLTLNNEPLEVNAVLNLRLSNIRLATAPSADGTLLIYVFWGTSTAEDFDVPCNSLTCVFPMAANEELTFQRLINQYVSSLPGKIKGIMCYNAEHEPAYMTLRDKELTYIINNAHTELMRPNIYNGTTAEDIQEHTFWLADLNIDFDYSRIRNAQNAAINQMITFYF